VDDDHATLAWMIPALEARGHEVRGTSSATLALDELARWTPDLILADILMPEMDGLTFARVTRQHRGVPVMFVSIAKKQAEAVMAGAVGYVQKPATAAEVRAAVDRVLGRRADRNTLIIVDDEPEVREIYRQILEPRFDVLSAENGLAALEVLSRHHVDLAIVDVHMPVMNGVALIREMRSTPRLQALPVIVQTSDRSALTAPVWRDLHVSQLIDKTEFLDWLMHQIAEHVGVAGPSPTHVGH
jgi:CheY-like chemotaxis protein